MTKRIKGLLGQIAGAVQNKDVVEDIHPPSYYVVGPTQTGISYLPGLSLVVPLEKGTSSEFAFQVENPFGVSAIIRSMMLDIRTPGQSSASIDIGLVDSSSETDTDIISSGSLTEALILPVIINGWDTKWAAKGSTVNAWITGKIKVDGASSLAGDVIIEVLPLFEN